MQFVILSYLLNILFSSILTRHYCLGICIYVCGSIVWISGFMLAYDWKILINACVRTHYMWIYVRNFSFFVLVVYRENFSVYRLHNAILGSFVSQFTYCFIPIQTSLKFSTKIICQCLLYHFFLFHPLLRLVLLPISHSRRSNIASIIQCVRQTVYKSTVFACEIIKSFHFEREHTFSSCW